MQTYRGRNQDFEGHEHFVERIRTVRSFSKRESDLENKYRCLKERIMTFKGLLEEGIKISRTKNGFQHLLCEIGTSKDGNQFLKASFSAKK